MAAETEAPAAAEVTAACSMRRGIRKASGLARADAGEGGAVDRRHLDPMSAGAEGEGGEREGRAAHQSFTLMPVGRFSSVGRLSAGRTRWVPPVTWSMTRSPGWRTRSPSS